MLTMPKDQVQQTQAELRSMPSIQLRMYIWYDYERNRYECGAHSPQMQYQRNEDRRQTCSRRC